MKRSNETPLKIFCVNPANCQNVKLSKLEFDFHEIFVTIKFFVRSPNETTGTFLKSQNGCKRVINPKLISPAQNYKEAKLCLREFNKEGETSGELEFSL